MFERFTERARRVVVLAQEESRDLSHDHIGTEHILLGLLREGEGVGARALEAVGVTLEVARKEVEEAVDRGEPPPRRSGKRWRRHVPFTPRAKKILELALREALNLGHNYIGTEHVLLGIVREGEGVANEILSRHGASADRIRKEVLRGLHGRQAPESMEVGEPAETEGGNGGHHPRCPQCHSLLEESGAVRALDLPVADGEGVRSVLVAFCRRCGTTIGTAGR